MSAPGFENNEATPPQATEAAGDLSTQAIAESAAPRKMPKTLNVALIGGGAVVLLGLVLGLALVMSLYKGASSRSQLGALPEKPVASGPLLPFATGSMKGLITHATPKSLGNFSFIDADKKTHHLSDFKGKVVVVNIWATWCAPCRTEMPTLAALAQSSDSGIKVIALSADMDTDFDKAKNFIETYRPLTLYQDPNFLATTQGVLNISGMPTTLILNKQGQEVARFSGEANWNTPEVKALLQHLTKS